MNRTVIFLADYLREDWPELLRHTEGMDDTYEEWKAQADDAAQMLAPLPGMEVRRVLITPEDFRRERARLGRRLSQDDRASFVSELGQARSDDAAPSGLPGLPKGRPR
jgi:hypothetical protein